MVEISDNKDPDGEKQISIKDIIILHIKKISVLCCQEFVGGHWERKPFKIGDSIVMTEIYHEDRREAFCNAMEFLVYMVYPLSDEQFKRYIDINHREIEDIKLKLKMYKLIFKEINIMFARFDFFLSTDVTNE